MKIKAIIISIICLFLFNCNFAAANSEPINIYFFWGDGCPHCAKEKVFLEYLKSKYPQIEVHSYEVWNNAENRQLLTELGQKLNINISGVPFTVVGEEHFIGWYDDQSTGKSIEDEIKCAIENGCRDVAGEVLATEEQKSQQADQKKGNSILPQKMNIPFVGEVETKNLSLPVLTIVFGTLDGFNPCAMWTLIFLITLLLGMKNKKRMWILGVAFLVASSSVYFLFMTAWLNLILFIGFIFWVRVGIGLVGLAAGGFNLKEYFTKPEISCKVSDHEKRKKTFDKLKEITQRESFYFALAGIILLAFAVNLVELICSAGFPAVYTQVLAISHLATWQYYLYILLYIFFFMLDDMIVFFLAMITLQATGLTTKYVRMSNLVGGVLMVIIGLLLIFKPAWLMFG